MSIDQAQAFVDGLTELSDTFREDSKATTDTYIGELEGATQEMKDASHNYAKEMVSLADKYVEDIQALYKQIYPDEKRRS